MTNKENDVNNDSIDNSQDQSQHDATKDNAENTLGHEQSPLEVLEDKLKDSQDKYLRLLAEFENSRRRSEKTQQDIAKYAIVDFAKDLVSSIDIFDKALLSVKDNNISDETFKSFIVGIELTKKDLEKTLSKFGVEKIDPINEDFDSNLHEALFAKEDKSKKDGIVCDVIEVGYKIHDRLLRSAKVGVVKNNQ